MDPQNPNTQTGIVSGAPSTPQVATAPVVNIPTAAATTPVVPVAAPLSQSPAAAQGTAPVITPKKLNIPKIDPKQIPEMLKKIPRKFKIMGGFVGLLFVLLILASFTKQGKQVKELILPSPSPIPASSPVGEVLIPTQYATDQEVLDIEKALTTFDSKLAGTDLKEDSLRVPNLDYTVDFTKQ